MNKTVKHCAVCQENFGDRFSFCPVCGEPLQAVAEGNSETFAAAPPPENAQIQPEKLVNFTAPPPVAEQTAQFNQAPIAEEKKSEAVKTEKNLPNKVSVAKAASPARRPAAAHRASKGEFHLTMLQTPKNYGRLFTSGAVFGLFFMLATIIGLLIYDLFAFPLDIAAVDDRFVLPPAYISSASPEPEEKIERKNTDKGGGGGGGGNEDPKEPSKGVDAAQMRAEPVIRPSVNNVQRDFELQQTPTTVGDQPKKEEGPYGIKSSKSLDPSDGPGRNGGQGTGIGGGQGSGNGTGKGSGNGSGSGGGNGDGNGNGRGSGDNGDEAPPVVRGPASEPVKILSTTRGRYTEEARKNSVSGTVSLRVTLGAGGQVTNVSVIRGLPYGLTESAIAAARQIKFVPAKKNGQPVSTNKVIEIGFNIY